MDQFRWVLAPDFDSKNPLESVAFVKLSLSDDCKNVNNDRLWPNNTLADVNMV